MAMEKMEVVVPSPPVRKSSVQGAVRGNVSAFSKPKVATSVARLMPITATMKGARLPGWEPAR